MQPHADGIDRRNPRDAGEATPAKQPSLSRSRNRAAFNLLNKRFARIIRFAENAARRFFLHKNQINRALEKGRIYYTIF